MKFFHIYAGRRTHDDVARVFECSTDEIRKAESSALRRRAAYYRPLLPNYSLLTPCLLRACALLTPCLLRAHYVFATRLLLTCLTHAVCAGFDTLSDLILSYLIYRRLRSHVQIRSVLRDSVDPYALENVDF